MAKSPENKGLIERGAGFFERLHYAIGGAALAGALILPELAAPLVTIGALEIAYGGLWTFIKNRAAKKPNLASV